MPELPDVEGFRRYWDRHAAGRRVRRLEYVDVSMLRETSAQAIGRVLRGRRLGRGRRHGKWLVCPAGGPSLLLHFGMTGLLVSSDEQPERHQHDRLVLVLDRGELRYRNMRKFGAIRLAADENAVEDFLARLGPDWLDVSRRQFDELLARRRASVKAALMDQTLAAGLGNLTADEALWQARLDPRRPVPLLSEEERAALFRTIRKVLRDSIPYGLVPAKRTWLTGSRERGPCPRCGADLARARIGGRTTVFCPREQR